MVNKIVDVPEGTLYLVAKNSMSKSIKSLPALNLQDAPTVAENATVEKPVIELPAIVIKQFETFKKNVPDNDFEFIKLVNSWYEDGVAWVGMYDALGWYLGHVEFVPKKEHKYRYRLIGFGNQYIDKDELGKLYITSRNTYSLSFTRREIEKQASEQGFKLSAFKEIEVEE